jgi:plastocyanin
VHGVRGGLVLAAVILAGCREAPEPVRAENGRLTVAQVDYRFEPQRIRAAAGRLRLTVVNRGRLPHTLRVAGGGREWLRVRSQLPGERSTVAARLPRGDYKLVCAIGNHEELGMWGTLVVR